MRIVLDTNVLVSALITGHGVPGSVPATVKREGHTLITSPHQIAELRDVLQRDLLQPFINREEADDLLYNLEAVAVVVDHLPEVDLSPDPDDNPILASAIAGRAELIVSGDKSHVLALGEVEGIAILNPRDALDRLERT